MSDSRLVEGRDWTCRMLAAAVVVFAVWFWVLPQKLHACECGGSDINSMKEYVAGSSAIFEGRVESMEILARRNSELGMGSDWLLNFALYTFTIERSYQGQKNGEIVIASGLGGGDCNVPFEVGSRYIVLASPSREYYKPYLETNECVLTENVNLAHAQIGFLRGEITTQKEWEKRRHQIFSPLGTDATISGRIHGFRETQFGQVEAWRNEKGQAVPFCVSRAVSKDGIYTVPVSAGSYIMRALQWPLADPFLIGYYPSGERIEEAIRVDVLSGQHIRSIDFEVKTPVTHTVTGRIHKSFWSILPMEGMDVELEDRDRMTLRPTRRTKCRADGTFEFKDVYPGRYHVKADFRFDEPEQSREWRAEVPVIRVPRQKSGTIIKVRSTGGSFLKSEARRLLGVEWIVIALITICISALLIYFIRLRSIRKNK